MRREYKTYKKVGRIKTSISEIFELDLSKSVYASPGAINHIKKRHGKQFTKRVKDNIIGIMEKIITEPDYAGIYYGARNIHSIELVKKINNLIILLGLKVDDEEDCIFVSTMYPITLSKLNARLYRGRLIKVDDIELNENIL